MGLLVARHVHSMLLRLASKGGAGTGHPPAVSVLPGDPPAACHPAIQEAQVPSDSRGAAEARVPVQALQVRPHCTYRHD